MMFDPPTQASFPLTPPTRGNVIVFVVDGRGGGGNGVVLGVWNTESVVMMKVGAGMLKLEGSRCRWLQRLFVLLRKSLEQHLCYHIEFASHNSRMEIVKLKTMSSKVSVYVVQSVFESWSMVEHI